MPPPPYTPSLPNPPTADPPEDSLCPPSTVPLADDSDVALLAGSDVLHGQIHSAYNPGKESTPGRYRRFTGDSGIEVCDGHELMYQHGFVEREGELEEDAVAQTEEPYQGREPALSEGGRADDEVVVDEDADGRAAAGSGPLSNA